MEALKSRGSLHPAPPAQGPTDPPTHSTPVVNGRSRVSATGTGVKDSTSAKSPGRGSKAKLLDRRALADTSVAESDTRPGSAPLGADQTLMANLSSTSHFQDMAPYMADYWAWRSAGGAQQPNRAVAHVHVVGGPTFARFADCEESV
jgi:hypothetical protein